MLSAATMARIQWERKLDRIILRAARTLSKQKEKAVKVRVDGSIGLAQVISLCRRQAARWVPKGSRRELLWERCLHLVSLHRGRRLVLQGGKRGRRTQGKRVADADEGELVSHVFAQLKYQAKLDGCNIIKLDVCDRGAGDKGTKGKQVTF